MPGRQIETAAETPRIHDKLEALARLLGRQAAREHFFAIGPDRTEPTSTSIPRHQMKE